MSKHHMEKVTCPFCHHEGVDIDNMYEFASSHCDDFKDLRDGVCETFSVNSL